MTDLTSFERFVESTQFVFKFLEQHTWIWLICSGGIVLFNWFIFRYHLTILEEYPIFRDNIHIAGRFCSTTYNAWRIIATSFVPLGIAIFLFSLFSRFDSIEFVRRFGIRKAMRSWDSVKQLPRGRTQNEQQHTP